MAMLLRGTLGRLRRTSLAFACFMLELLELRATFRFQRKKYLGRSLSSITRTHLKGAYAAGREAAVSNQEALLQEFMRLDRPTEEAP